MVDPASISKVAQEVAEKSAQEAVPQQTEAPDAQDVSKFEAAMNGQQQNGVGPAEQNAPATADKVAKADQPGSIGDAILEGMEKVKESRDEGVKKVNEILDKSGDEPMDIQDVMRLQVELMELNLQTEVTTKAADKSNQGVQTLLKNQ
jgi:type III secretion protein I